MCCVCFGCVVLWLCGEDWQLFVLLHGVGIDDFGFSTPFWLSFVARCWHRADFPLAVSPSTTSTGGKIGDVFGSVVERSL